MRQINFFLCTFLLLMISCTQDDDTVYTKNNTPSGEELFKAIFLLEGDLSKKISYYQPILAQTDEFEKQHPEYLIDKSQKIKKIMNLIKSNDNSYFDELKKSIDSKDVKRVESTILRGVDLIKAVSIIDYSKMNNSDILSQYDFSDKNELKSFLESNQLTYKKILSEEENNAKSINPNKETCLFPFAVVAVAIWEGAVAVNVVAVATVAVAIKAAFWDPTESLMQQERKTTLEKDIFLKEITFDLVR